MYDLTNRDWLLLRTNWWANNCWGKWGFSFSRLLDDVKHYPNFDNNKFHTLTDDLDFICDNHDIDFSRWWWLIDFTKCNLLFAIRVYKKLGWTHFTARIASFLIIMTWLTLIGRKYFYWGVKRDLKYLLNNTNV